MSDLGNKKVFSENFNYYMKLYNKDRNKICDDLKFKYSTVRDWALGNTYPRIDRIEMLANYFGIKKSDLIEKKDTLITDIEKGAKLTEQIMALGNKDIEKELLVSCTMLDPQQQEVVLNMVKLYLEKDN